MFSRIYLLSLILIFNWFFIEIDSSFINPYPRFRKFKDNGDPGTPLYLTPLINQGQLGLARAKSKVEGLVDGIIGYSGYITVNEKLSSNMFFWYFPPATNTTASTILWLQGGPGASSLFGLFCENGPYALAGKYITKRNLSWHLNHHLIYIDNPVGTGFSFTEKDSGYVTNEKEVGRDLYTAIKQIFTLFDVLQTQDFYIMGESYAGKYVPALAITIHDAQKGVNKKDFTIPLKGLAIGNGFSDPIHQVNYGDFLYQIGLIDSNGRETFKKYEKEGLDCIKTYKWSCAFEAFDTLINMDKQKYGSVFQNLTGYDMYYNYLKTKPDDSEKGLGKFLQSTETRRAIHVGSNTFHDLIGENKVEEYLKNDIMNSVSAWIGQLLDSYEIYIYSGQLDIIVGYPLTLKYLEKLKFSGRALYKQAKRCIWKVDGEIAGYYKKGGNLHEILVRNAGHMAPKDQPKWVFDMVTRITSNKDFC